ncbi:MAG TPA: hypothetical protein VHA52_12950, partial [Candidatus Babeliaceae bacterium]|nr:hypothetical protein [Candidatus Babeliaceae bacterium]
MNDKYINYKGFAMIQAIVRFIGSTMGYAGLIGLARFFKVSYIVGSWGAFFALDQCLLPLAAGSQSGLLGLMLAIALSLGSGLYTPFLLVYSFPTFLGTLYLKACTVSSINKYTPYLLKAFVVLILISCIVGFISHPVGNQVYYYASFWLLPLSTIFLS